MSIKASSNRLINEGIREIFLIFKISINFNADFRIRQIIRICFLVLLTNFDIHNSLYNNGIIIILLQFLANMYAKNPAPPVKMWRIRNSEKKNMNC